MNRLNAILNWSVRVGRLFDVPVHFHISLLFFLLPVISAAKFSLWYGVEYVGLVVLSILLHELGHALTAKRYGLKGLSIMLHGFGGFAVARGYRSPRQALVIALAGPAVTFAIGFLGLFVGSLINRVDISSSLGLQLFLIGAVGRLNILLGVLNLFPSLPFDGGNALRAIWTGRMFEDKATRRVAHLGLVLSPLLALYGLFTGQNFVAIFGLVGLIASYTELTNTGGIRLGEAVADRREDKERAAAKQRADEKSRAYLDDVVARQKAREERERLRKLLEGD